MEQGAIEQKIIEDCARFNQPLPERIANAPELNLGLELYHSGFIQLSRSRPSGFGLAAIPLSNIVDYCTIYSIIGEQMEDFIWFITEVDQLFMSWWNEKHGKS